MYIIIRRIALCAANNNGGAVLYNIHYRSLQTYIRRYRSHFPLFWLPHEPFTVAYLRIYLYLSNISLSRSLALPVIDDGVDSGGGGSRRVLPDRSKRTKIWKNASVDGAGVVRLIFVQEGPRRTSRTGEGVFASGHSSDRSVLPASLSLSLFTEGSRNGVAKTFFRRTIRERNDAAGVDEWLFIATENIPVIRLLSRGEKCERTYRNLPSANPVAHEYLYAKLYHPTRDIRSVGIFILSC